VLTAVVGLALLATAWRAPAADAPPRPADPGGADDVLDLLYLTDARPYVFRLHLIIDGKPYTVRWAERVQKVFNYLDRDGDGALSKDEVMLAPAPQQMAQLFHGVPYSTVAFNDAAAIFKEMDADGDGKVTPAEFLAYYRRSAAGPAQLVGAPGRAVGTDAVTDKLFQILDVEKKGKLSKQDLAVADRVLQKYDLNDDEIITADELLQAPRQPALPIDGALLVQQQAPQSQVVPLGESPFQLVPREEAPKRITERLKVAKDLLARYDKNKDGKLSPSEIGVPQDVFDRYDADRDGAWSATELLRWMIFEPDLEAVVRLGRVDEKDGLLDLVSPREAAAPPAPAVHKAAFNALSLGTSDALLSLIRSGVAFNYSTLTETVYQSYDQQFLAIDKEDRRFITRQQCADGNNPMMYQAFPIIDADGDGRVTEQEIKAWVALATESIGSVPQISVADNGRALFEMLDVNNDGRLTLRELRGAWARLAPYDRRGEGAVARDEIPQQFQITVVEAGLDPNVLQQQQALQPQAQAPAPAPGPMRIERGPLWFRKMDVNGDGDVSPREFLGSLEDFKRIDTDGDGLISVEEAEAFDALMRAKNSDK
jgi:Ca2+-binding EF-hand superfamily protein